MSLKIVRDKCEKHGNVETMTWSNGDRICALCIKEFFTAYGLVILQEHVVEE